MILKFQLQVGRGWLLARRNGIDQLVHGRVIAPLIVTELSLLLGLLFVLSECGDREGRRDGEGPESATELHLENLL